MLSARGAMLPMCVALEFRDVVFEDVVFDKNRCYSK